MCDKRVWVFHDLLQADSCYPLRLLRKLKASSIGCGLGLVILCFASLGSIITMFPAAQPWQVRIPMSPTSANHPFCSFPLSPKQKTLETNNGYFHLAGIHTHARVHTNTQTRTHTCAYTHKYTHLSSTSIRKQKSSNQIK